MTVNEHLVDWAYRAGWQAVRRIPLPVASALFRAGADRALHRRGRGVKRLATNLRRVVGPDLPEAEFEALLRVALRSYARYYLEAFRLPNLSREQIQRSFILENEHELAAAVHAGRGAIVALPHSGNWDLAGAWVASRDWPIVAVAERLRPESVYRRFMAFRESIGMEVIPLTGAERPLVDMLDEKLRKGYVVALLADRDLPGRGVKVDFFGAPTTMPPGPALLALRTGAPLFAVDVWNEPGVTHALLHEIPPPDPSAGSLDARVRLLTQAMADQFARCVSAHPADWHMLQRMWPEGQVQPGDKK